MTTAMYAVDGMMCESCMAAVLENVHSVSGVTVAAMDLVAGGRSPLIVTSNTKLGADTVRHAVEHVGFAVLPPGQERPEGRNGRVTWGGDANPGRERMMIPSEVEHHEP